MRVFFNKSLIYLCILLVSGLSYSRAFALLDVNGSDGGKIENRAELKLLYTFDESNDAELILNQLHKDDLSHPSHLQIKGLRSNLLLENGSINFLANTGLNNEERRHVSSSFGSEVTERVNGERTKVIVTAETKKQKGRKAFQNAVYLESQGEVNFADLCTDDSEATLQVFFKPRKVNYSNYFANIFRMQPPGSRNGTIALAQQFNNEHLITYVNGRRTNFRYNDLAFDGKQNEGVITFNPTRKVDGYFLLHSSNGKEGWESVEDSGGRSNIINYPGSKILIGTAALLHGAGVDYLTNQLNQLSGSNELKDFIMSNTGGYIGSIQQVAFYCRFTDRSEALGGEYRDTTNIKVTPSLVGEPTRSEKIAVRLLSLMTKKKIPVDADLVKEAAVHISRGNYEEAAKIGVELPDFYNNTVKDFALKMSNREQTVDVPLNDFAATMIGSVRDSVDARLLLTGNYYYRADGLVGVPADVKTHMLKSNIHYEELDKGGYDLKKALVRVSGQKILRGTNEVVDHPDPAGVLTSRAYLSAHATAGTNRRPVEYAFKQFMCLELSEVADTESSDLRVGRDIDRFPAGSHKKYQTSCKGCHTIMDGFRGAFAKVDFDMSQTFVKHGDLQSVNIAFVNRNRITYPANISYKLNHNEFSFPSGYVTKDDSFYNFADRGTNKFLLGWRSDVKKGFGMGQFGKMLSHSQRFSKCMVKRVFESVCPVNIDESLLSKLGPYVTNFEQSRYNLKKLFLNASISPYCLGGN